VITNFIKKTASIFTAFGLAAFYNATAQLTPFDCSSGLGYILTNTDPGTGNVTSLYSFDLTTGASNIVKADLLPASPANQRFYNGFGYNTVDNFLYGYRYNTSEIVKVGVGGNIERLTMTGSVSNGSYAAGDVSPQGILYLFGSGRFISVDLNPASPNYLAATLKLNHSSTINDFAFSPVDGNIYGITSTAARQLFRFNPATNTITILGAVNGLSTETNDSFGTAFMDNLGNLFIGNNTSGRIFRVQTPHLLSQGATISATLYSSALAGRTPGDGARCSSQIILPSANNDQACSPSASTFPILITVSGNDGAGSYPLVNSSVRLLNASSQPVNTMTTPQGTFTVNTTSGVIQFQPLASFTSGTATARYWISDSQGNISAPATITVSVCAPPTAVSDMVSGVVPGQTARLNTILTNDTAPATTTLIPATINLIASASIPSSISEDTDADGDIDQITVPGQGVWKVDASGNVTFTPQSGFLGNPTPISYTVKNSTGAVSNPASISANYLPLATISGNVFVDGNGLSDETVNGVSYSSQGLYALLVSVDGKILASQEISTSGTYTFANVLHGSYNVQLNNKPGVVGDDAPTQSSLPSGGNWLFTGEHVGAAAGNDSEANGIISITVTGNLPDVNFGINQAPTAALVNDMIPSPKQGDTYTFKPLTGSDPQDGEYANFSPGTSPEAPKPTVRILGSTFQVLAAGSSSPAIVLNYGSTTLSTTSDNAAITNFDFAELSATLNGSGYVGFQFEYVIIDAAGAVSEPVIYKVEWTSPLPVKLISFNALTEGNQVLLVWSTTEESNSDKFEIQRSSDGRDWFGIGQLEAVGESRLITDYRFTDLKALHGRSYYRLKMIDNDQTFAYSSIVTVLGESTKALIFAPNPSRDFVTISGLQGGEYIEIMNPAGLKVANATNNSDSFKYDISNFTSGTYIISVTNIAGEVVNHRIVKL
jgi:CshA-type fibril repeat protein